MKSEGRVRLKPVMAALLAAVFGVSIYLVNARNQSERHLPMLFGYGAAVVLSGSMEPELSIGDLILIHETDAFELDDVVVYQSRSSLVVHRIVDIQENMITTQGDANNVADRPVDSSSIKGKVWMTIPYAGRVVNFLKTPLGIGLTIAIALFLSELSIRFDKDDERERLIEEINELKKEIGKDVEGKKG